MAENLYEQVTPKQKTAESASSVPPEPLDPESPKLAVPSRVSLFFLILAGIILVLVPGGIAYLYIHAKENSVKTVPVSSPVHSSPGINSREITVSPKISTPPSPSAIPTKRLVPPSTPTPHPTIKPKPTSTPRLTPTPITSIGYKQYKNTEFGFRVQIPTTWEAFMRDSLDDSVQIGFHPVGHEDAPIVLNAYHNPQDLSLTEAIDSKFGVGYPRSNKVINGKPVTVVFDTNQNYTSYFFTNGSEILEISESTVTNAYDGVVTHLLQTLSFQ